MAVYSTRFGLSFFGAGNAGDHTFYTVPAGHRAIVRSLTALSYAAGASAGLLFPGTLELTWWKSTATFQWFSEDLRLVFNAGESMAWRIDANGWALSAHGYLLAA